MAPSTPPRSERWRNSSRTASSTRSSPGRRRCVSSSPDPFAFLAGPPEQLAPELLGITAVIAYSYMASVAFIQPPLMRLLTAKSEREIEMKPPREVARSEKHSAEAAVQLEVGEELAGMIDSVKRDRTDTDLLFQVLLDWGLDLSMPITRETVAGNALIAVDDGALIGLFANGGVLSTR